MKYVLFPLTLSAAILAAPSFADTFQSEVSAGYADHTDSHDADVTSLGAKVYLNPISTDNGPYELNGFLSHSSYLQAGMGFNHNLDTYSIGGRLVTSGDLVLGAHYENFDFDHHKDADSYGIEAGGYLNDGTLLTGYYNRLDWSPFDADTWGARIKSYNPLVGDTGLLLKADINNTNVDRAADVFSASVGADYFYNKQWSTGLAVDYINTKDDAVAYLVNGTNDTTYYANTSYWFNPRANVSVGVNKTSGEDGMGWAVKAAYRF